MLLLLLLLLLTEAPPNNAKQETRCGNGNGKENVLEAETEMKERKKVERQFGVASGGRTKGTRQLATVPPT